MSATVALRSHACRLADRIAMAAVLGLLGLAVLTVADVTGRALFTTPIRGFNDIVPLAGAVLLSACMPHVVARRANIAVELVGQRLGAAASRRLDGFGALLCTAFFALMAWQYLRYAVELQAAGDVTPILRWPVWPWWSAVALFISIAAGVGLLTLGAGEPAREGA